VGVVLRQANKRTCKILEVCLRLEIRSAAVRDAEAILYAPIVENTTISFEYVPPTVQEMAERIAVALQENSRAMHSAGGCVGAGRTIERDHILRLLF
jgi:hypothetical protein